MPTGYIYIVKTATKGYMQRSCQDVPSEYDRRIFFGPCKGQIRRKIKRGDYLVGISPAGRLPRRVLFVARIAESMTFAEAYRRFPRLRGPDGPIHVRPVKRSTELFPKSDYEHIRGADHKDGWINDLKTKELDKFLVGVHGRGWVGRWLGQAGPPVDQSIIRFLRGCAVYGRAGRLSEKSAARLRRPVAYGHLTIGLHLETTDPETLIELCKLRIDESVALPGCSCAAVLDLKAVSRGGCGQHRS